MNGLQASLRQVTDLVDRIRAGGDLSCEVVLCPPATLLGACATLVAASPLVLGGQDCHPKASGAFTGEISPEMLADYGATYVILGHSERRQYFSETPELIKQKLLGAQRAALRVILCIGETEEQQKNGQTHNVLERQLLGSLPESLDAEKIVIAYEPVWAIGTGLTPTPADVAHTHGFIRECLIARDPVEGAKIRIIYGGSVNPQNASELLNIPEVAGALVGGASLKAEDFWAIIQADTAIK